MNAHSSGDSHAERHRTTARSPAMPFLRTAIHHALVLILFLCLAAAGVAQQRPNAKAGAESPRDLVNRNFESKAPGIGEPLPDITVVDADGREFALRSLRGKHTVLVFGCLT